MHHRFRDKDGNCKKRVIKDKSGNPVHSYCRSHLVFDRADNAYVIANGAEIYIATSARDYDDWTLLTDVDKERFISEPQVDRTLLLKAGVLSYVYLADDGRLVVVDYLLDNPHVPEGTGLFAECFSDNIFKNRVSSETNVRIDSVHVPPGTNSIRWSGTFETLYAEDYTLYLTTSSQALVSIDNKVVLMTEISPEKKEYEIKFPPIASHKHAIVIEMVGTDISKNVLAWSSDRTQKEAMPEKVFYGEITH